MKIFWQSPTNNGPFTIPTLSGFGIDFEDGNWHCIAVVRSGPLAEIYLDGTLVFSNSTIGTLNTDLFRVGHWGGGTPTPNQDWLGRVDEVKLWNTALSPAQLTACSPCMLTGQEPGLVAYWQFDQGLAGGNNSSSGSNPITQALDASVNGNHGVLHPSTATPDSGFVLTPGLISNFVTSGAPIVYPNYNSLSLIISDPLQQFAPILVCDNDPVHFTLLDRNGNIPQPSGGVSVDWFYRDNGGSTWSQITSLSGFQFVVPPTVGANIGATDITCTPGASYVDREYRAEITVTNSNGTCTYTTDPAQLRICCEVTQAVVTVVSTPAGPLCEGDVATFNVSLATNILPASNPFGVTISWSIGTTPLPQFDEMLSFVYPVSGQYTVGQQDICFTATITNCGCPSVTAQACIQVDPKPVCGYLTGLPYNNPTNLTLISIIPWPTYEICPGNDAIVGINPTTPFTNCNPQWQYSLDPFPFNWIDIGFSNPAQNTNILPAHFTPPWSPSQQNIYYRVECRPLSNPSGCAPCLSNNIIEIRLKPVLSKPVISCNPASQIICYGGTATLTVALDPQVTQWTWYCNGAIVGTGPSVTVDKKACYWVEATDGCSTSKSDPLCLDVCTVFAIIKCPEDNPCAIPNLPVTMSGISSYSTCGFIDQYDWEVEDLPSGTTHFYSGPTVTFTPPPAGSIVMLTVTDSNGCIHSAQGFIKPCQP